MERTSIGVTHAAAAGISVAANRDMPAFFSQKNSQSSLKHPPELRSHHIVSSHVLHDKGGRRLALHASAGASMQINRSTVN
jgi:hypothetical protein